MSLIKILYNFDEHALEESMDLGRRQSSKVFKRSAGSNQVVSYFLDNVKIVQHCWEEWQAMSGKVAFLTCRYHNHLDKSINTS
jgi:hypothetical protein